MMASCFSRRIVCFFALFVLVGIFSSPAHAFKSSCPLLLAGSWKDINGTLNAFAYSCDVGNVTNGAGQVTRYTTTCSVISDTKFGVTLTAANNDIVMGEFAFDGVGLGANMLLALGPVNGAAGTIDATTMAFNRTSTGTFTGSAYLASALCLSQPNDVIRLVAGVYPTFQPPFAGMRFVGDGITSTFVSQQGAQTITIRAAISPVAYAGLYFLSSSSSSSITIDGGIATFNGTRFSTTGNVVPLTCDNGGAFNMSSAYFGNYSVTVTGGNIAGRPGGAMRIGRCEALVADSMFERVSTNSHGGCIATAAGTNLTVLRTTFTSCYALSSSTRNGGSIYVSSSNRVVIDSSTFYDSYSQGGNGGTIYISGATAPVVISKSSFSLSLTFNSGGAVYVSSSPKVDITECSFENNEGYVGGALFFNEVLATNISRSTFANGYGEYKAGVLHYQASAAASKLTMASCNATKNFVRYDNSNAQYGVAGAISLSGTTLTAEVTGSIFDQNMSLDDSDGGVVLAEGSVVAKFSQCTFQKNSGYFGSVFLVRGSTVTVCDQCTFTLNNGIFGSVYCEEKAQFGVTNSIFDTNNGRTSAGIYATDFTTIRANDTSFHGNTATRGSAIAFDFAAVSVALRNASFSQNAATETGGAIYASLTGKQPVPCLSIDGATSNGDSAPQGGFLWVSNAISVDDRDVKVLPAPVESKPSVLLNNVNVVGAHATEGGALHLLNTVVTIITNSRFTNCTADNGGTGHMSGSPITVLSNTIVEGSRASTGGAFVVTENGVLLVRTGSSFVRSVASGGGGGVSLQLDAVLNMTDSVAGGNGAVFGGFLALSGRSKSFIQNSNILYNRADDYAGAVAMSSASQLTVSNVSFTGNCASGQGGAFRVEGSATLIAQHGDPNVTAAVFSLNGADEGGALYVRNGASVSMTSVRFESNRAALAGGAVFAADCSTVDLAGVHLVKNGAFDGGQGGAILFQDSSSVRLTNSTLAENTARDGGAVYGRIVTSQTSVCGSTNSTEWWSGRRTRGLARVHVQGIDSNSHFRRQHLFKQRR
eukprot:Opistho-2@92950